VHYVLFYDYVDGILERRGPYRDAHLALARARKDEGTIVMAGALGDPPHGALFVFSGDDPNAAATFVGEDPYVGAGLVTSWRVEPWNVVI
jgi:uncharacterized protein